MNIKLQKKTSVKTLVEFKFLADMGKIDKVPGVIEFKRYSGKKYAKLMEESKDKKNVDFLFEQIISWEGEAFTDPDGTATEFNRENWDLLVDLPECLIEASRAFHQLNLGIIPDLDSARKN